MVDHLIQNEEWEERFEENKSRGNIVFPALVFESPEKLSLLLTEEEQARLQPKLQMVQDLASKLAWGMVKGTIKYPSDDYTPKQWLDHLFDEVTDAMNYTMLYLEAKKRDDGC